MANYRIVTLLKNFVSLWVILAFSVFLIFILGAAKGAGTVTLLKIKLLMSLRALAKQSPFCGAEIASAYGLA